MITRRTKIQLLVFVLITLLGVTYVGARYAQLDRYFVSQSYPVTVHLEASGGIFSGAQVAYRGVEVGRVGELKLTEQGVDAVLDIDNDHKKIPADTRAVVANGSAVGEQFIDLQPQTDSSPYLKSGSQVAEDETELPISTNQLLTNTALTVGSVNRDALATTVSELGQAFAGTGPDLQRIIDTGNSFINLANDNFDTTTALIRDSNTVLNTQIDSESSLRSFAADLSSFSDTLAASDDDLRGVIDNGSPALNQLESFIRASGVDLGQLLNNLITTGNVVNVRLNGVKAVLSIYPYVVEGGFTVVTKTPSTGLYDAHFGMIMTDHTLCHGGYQSTDTRTPQDGSNRAMNERAGCTEPATESNPRGPQNLDRAAASYSPPVAAYDPTTGDLTFDPNEVAAREAQGVGASVAPASLGKETWKWLFLQPLTTGQE